MNRFISVYVTNTAAYFLRQVCLSPLHFFSTCPQWHLPGGHLQTILQPERLQDTYYILRALQLPVLFLTHVIVSLVLPTSCSAGSLPSSTLSFSLCRSLSHPPPRVFSLQCLLSRDILHSVKSVPPFFLRRTAIKPCLSLLPASSLALLVFPRD